MSGEDSSLRVQTYRLARDRKDLMEGLERGRYFVEKREFVLTVRAEPPDEKRRMRAHPTWQLERLCDDVSAQHTNEADVLGQ